MATKSVASERALKGAATRRANREMDKQLAGDYPDFLYDREKDELIKLSLRERAMLNFHRNLPADLKPRWVNLFKLTGDELKAEAEKLVAEYRAREQEAA